MAIKRRDFQKLSSTVQEFLLKLPDEEASARLRDNLLHALHFLQLYYRVLQNRDKDNDPLQWNIDHSLSPLTPFKEAPDKFEWEWLNVENQRAARQSLQKNSMDSNFKHLPAMINAIKDDDLNAVKQLVKDDASCVNSVDLFQRDCLTYAVQYDRIEILRYLLKNGANVNNLASDSSTCLHRAVYNGKPDMVQLLLEHKANINSQDNFNRAPLHWSVVNESVDCLRVLLKHGPNSTIKDRDGLSPSMWACHLDHVEHFKLLSKIDNVNKKFESISKNELETDNDGRTWMHWSVRKMEPIQCLTLLLNNESATLRDNEGKTCLHVAAEQGALPACKLILSVVGSKIINERDNKKQTPLHLATLNGHARAIKILMDGGADPNVKDTTGASSVDYVTKRNLIFCNSMIEMCLRNIERRNRLQGASSSNSMASSLNGSESNLTPAPPTTPKNSYTRSFQQLPFSVSSSKDGRPPRPLNNSLSSSMNNETTTNTSATAATNNAADLIKTAPASLGNNNEKNSNNNNNNNGNFLITETKGNVTTIIPSPPPNGSRTRPNHRGWVSAERVMSGSLRLSRTSTRTSFASEDLDKYLSNTNNMGGTMESQFGGSLGNIENILPTIPNGFYNNNNNANVNNATTTTNNNLTIPGNGKSLQQSQPQPQPQPRTASSSSMTNNNNGNNAAVAARMMSGRSQQDMGLNSGSMENLPHQIPPPIKPRKSSSITSLNNSNLDQQQQQQTMNKLTANHYTTNPANEFIINKPTLNSNKNNLDVEDISGDELSITSVKGEGFASDLSDSEIRHQPNNNNASNHRTKIKRSAAISGGGNPSSDQHNQKRPTTPMDVRAYEQQSSMIYQPHHMLSQHKHSAAANKSVKFQQIGDQHVSTRFNEWEPKAAMQNSNNSNNNYNYNSSSNNDNRQKSPLKSKQQQSLQTGQQQQSNFAHSFLTDSSPRQTSGRSQIGSANMNNFLTQKHSQMSPQHQQHGAGGNNMFSNSIFGAGTQSGIGANSTDMVSSSNLDLIISGQKLGGNRKESSPTNLITSATPRDSSSTTQQGGNNQQSQSSQSQSLQSQRPFTKIRLQPLDKTILEQTSTTVGGDHFGGSSGQLSSKNVKNKGFLERKKLEPLKSSNHHAIDILHEFDNHGTNSVTTSTTAGASATHNNHFSSNNNAAQLNNDEDPSVSENTSSDNKQSQQLLNGIRINKKKILK